MAHQQDAGSRGAAQAQALSERAGTIAAIATPAGRGGIGVVRVSGPGAGAIAVGMLGMLPAPRHATLCDFRDEGGAVLDRGIALHFPAPHSYTGEDVLELQGHGGPVVLQEVLRCCVAWGARVAQPGEFTRRAFLNDRIDLAQAESVADLIDAASCEAARSAARSLTGEFSHRIHALVASVVGLRAHVEACIDFPEEEIDPADRQAQARALAAIRADLAGLLEQARQGAVLREGLTVVLIGRPNVGKSSLLNRLAGEDLAIVTPIPGTTRDHVRATLSLEGVPVHLIDTAGLRESADEIERLGIERTWRAIEGAGAALFITEGDAGAAGPEVGSWQTPEVRSWQTEEAGHLRRLPAAMPVARVVNKIDLTGLAPGLAPGGSGLTIRLSAKTGAGVEALRTWLLQTAGWQPHEEGLFMARERHLGALKEAGTCLERAESNSQVFELYAEELRLAQQALGRITGEVSADDLLGEIFSRFCIGK